MFKRKVFLTLFMILFVSSSYTYEWDSGLKSFTLGMTINEVEHVLLRYHPKMTGTQSYSSLNYYFLKSKYFSDENLYFNDQNYQITQLSRSVEQFVDGKLILKKAFGYRLGAMRRLNGTQLYGSNIENLTPINYSIELISYGDNYNSVDNKIKELKKELKIEMIIGAGETILLTNLTKKDAERVKDELEKIGAKVEIKSFTPKLSYQYRHFPVSKVNTYLYSIVLNFFNDRLFNIKYELELNSAEKKVFMEYLNKTYTKEYDKDGNLIQFKDKIGNMDIIIKVTQLSVDESADRHFIKIEYIDKTKLEDFNNYIKNGEKKIFEMIEKSMYQQIKDF